MRTIRVTAILDESREVRIPAPEGLLPGDKVELEVRVLDSPVEKEQVSPEEWQKLVDDFAGSWADCPIEDPTDPPPEPAEIP